MRRDARTAGACLLGAMTLLAACATSHRPAGVFAVERGMTKRQVQKLAGAPYRAGPNCWLYHAAKSGTGIDGMRICFTRGRVSLVQTAVHG